MINKRRQLSAYAYAGQNPGRRRGTKTNDTKFKVFKAREHLADYFVDPAKRCLLRVVRPPTWKRLNNLRSGFLPHFTSFVLKRRSCISASATSLCIQSHTTVDRYSERSSYVLKQVMFSAESTLLTAMCTMRGSAVINTEFFAGFGNPPEAAESSYDTYAIARNWHRANCKPPEEKRGCCRRNCTGYHQWLETGGLGQHSRVLGAVAAVSPVQEAPRQQAGWAACQG